MQVGRQELSERFDALLAEDDNRYRERVCDAAVLGSTVTYQVEARSVPRLIVNVQDPRHHEIRVEGENVGFRSDADQPVVIHP